VNSNNENPFTQEDGIMAEKSGRTIRVIVDMQNDFIDGALGSSQAPKIVDGCVRKAADAFEKGDIVIFTRDTHNEENYMISEEGRNLPVPHCIRDTEGWQIASAFGKMPEEAIVFDKGTFGSVQLGEKIAELCRSEVIESVELCGLCTDICVISFIDLYEKVVRNFPQIKPVAPKERITIGKAFADIGNRYGITIKACAEGNDLAEYGIDCSGCMTKETFETAVGSSLDIPKKKTQRAECSCVLGTDIGAYDTCAHFCRYCYANSDRINVKRNMRLHDPGSPFLTGSIRDGETIHQAEQYSWIDGQLSFF
jgi:hypothetical protein